MAVGGVGTAGAGEGFLHRSLALGDDVDQRNQQTVHHQTTGGLGEELDFVVLENVGNLVCPAEFDTGAVKNAMILSVPEGHDKPLKYPLMFEKADVVVLNKVDAIEAFDFSPGRFHKYMAERCPDAPVFMVSAATGEGMAVLAEWLNEKANELLK